MDTEHAFERIACIGAGPIGLSWSQLFLDYGYKVALYDPDPRAEEMAPEDTLLPGSLESVLQNADLVIECIPERLDLKRSLCEEIEPLIEARTVFASSSSAIPVSWVTKGRSFGRRSLVVHPFNPPHIIPLVELVPASYTDPCVVARVAALLEHCGRTPVRLHREVVGFVGNRLAMALYREALHLIGDGVIDPSDLDHVVSEGLGPRWACAGPSETYHLNQDQGFTAYFDRIADHLNELAMSLNRDAVLNREGLRRVAEFQDSIEIEPSLRRRARDRLLQHILDAKEIAGHPGVFRSGQNAQLADRGR